MLPQVPMCILSAKCMDGKLLYKKLANVIVGLKNINCRVVGVCFDNNSFNRKAMSMFAARCLMAQEPVLVIPINRLQKPEYRNASFI